MPVLLHDMSGSGDGLASYPLSRMHEWGATGWGGADKRKGAGAGAMWRGGVGSTAKGGAAWRRGAACPRAPPFCVNRGGADTGEGQQTAVHPLSACKRGGSSQCRRSERVIYPHVCTPSARTWRGQGEGRGWGNEERWSWCAILAYMAGTLCERKGPELVLEPVPLSPPPACQFVKNWRGVHEDSGLMGVCRPLPLCPRHPYRVKRGCTMAHRCLSPLPLASPSPLVHAATFTQKGGTQGGMPPFPHVCATPFTWKEGAWGMPLPVAPHLLSTVRATPFTRKRGVRGYIAPLPFTHERGAQKGMPLPFPLHHPVCTEREGHTTPPLHVTPTPSPFPLLRAPSSPPLAQMDTQEGHARAPPCPCTQDGDNAPTPVSLGAGNASPAPHTQGDGAPTLSPLRGGGVGTSDPSARATSAPHEGQRAQPSPPLREFTRHTQEEECVGRMQARTRRGSQNEAVKPEHEGLHKGVEQSGAQPGWQGELHTNGRVGASERGCERVTVMVMAGVS
ncbi:hypothetical protein EDB83DRAFT_2316233 [Lactarius deliciosus]|nr:hypothetical protein EDB83DRAFT_2316233 [Lactarius deliciosus]